MDEPKLKRSDQVKFSNKIKRISKSMIRHYLTPPVEEVEAEHRSTNKAISSPSSLHASEMSELMTALNLESKEAERISNVSADRLSFVEHRYLNPQAELLQL